MSKIKILVCEPHAAPRVDEIEDDLHSLQNVVGGLIEAIYPPQCDDNALIFGNDEAKLAEMPPNRLLFTTDGTPYDVICGTFFITAEGEDGELTSLTDAQIAKYSELYAEYLTEEDAGRFAELIQPRFAFIGF